MRYLFLLFIFSCSLNTSFGQKAQLCGSLKTRHGKPLAYATVCIDKTDTCIRTDIKGNFCFDSLPEGKYTLFVSYLKERDTIPPVVLKAGQPARLDLLFPTTCKYDASRNNNVCPKCGKNDMVVPIVYGKPQLPVDENRFFYAGCKLTLCDPNWFCKRDRLRF